MKRLKTVLNITLLIFLAMIPHMWVLVISDYQTWRLYKREGYNVPKFIIYLYDYNFTQKQWTKSNK